MKNKNAVFETFKTKEGKIYFVMATVFLIAGLCVNNLVSNDWTYKKFVLLGCGLFMFIGCIMFTQYVGVVQNELDRLEAEENRAKHGHKKK